MEKNQFLMINDLISNIYSWNAPSDIDDIFFQRLKMIIPFSYASLFLHEDNAPGQFQLSSTPICYPVSFAEAEQHYLDQADNDYLLWILRGKESQLIRESDIIDEAHRLESPLYQNCYRNYNIYDSMQFTIVYQQTLYGVLTLFRTHADGVFSTDDMFYLRSIGLHLNSVIYNIMKMPSLHHTNQKLIQSLQSEYMLTSRECDILQLLFSFQDNKEIADAFDIRENTLQKHLQNLFRKLNVNSKWELMRKFYD